MKRKPSNQLPLFNGLNPFSQDIDQNNRWIKLNEVVPWDELEAIYRRYFHPDKQSVIKDSQLILGLLLGQMMMNLSDRGILEYFHENPYFQYFCGQEYFQFKLDQTIIHYSLLSKRRKKLGNSFMKKFDQEVLAVLKTKGLVKGRKLMLDATVFPSNIGYPNDVKLLNTVREWLCDKILDLKNRIDPKKKIRTYRKIGRWIYRKYQRTKNKQSKMVRKTRNQMIRLVNRNINQIQLLIDQIKTNPSDYGFSSGTFDRMQSHLHTARIIYQQQLKMATTRGKSTPDRIVNLFQPWLRPIIRGKEGKKVEFGGKAHVSIADGYAFLDHFEFNAYHEGNLLPDSLEQHKNRFERLPEVVLADQLYGTRKNRHHLKELNIKDAFNLIGRPPEKDCPDHKKKKRNIRLGQRKRNQIEGVFGFLKENFRMNRITSKTESGSEQQVRLGLISFNLLQAAQTI